MPGITAASQYKARSPRSAAVGGGKVRRAALPMPLGIGCHGHLASARRVAAAGATGLPVLFRTSVATMNRAETFAPEPCHKDRGGRHGQALGAQVVTRVGAADRIEKTQQHLRGASATRPSQIV